MNPKAKKRKPEGTKITLGGKNKASQIVNRRNKAKSNRNKRQDARSININARRSDRAVKKGNVKEVSKTVEVSPASTRVVSKGKPASSRIVTGSKFVSNEVRAGDSKTFGKERKGTAPKADASGNYGQRLQAALKEGRAAGKETIVFEGKTFAAGKNVKTSKVVTTPATKDVTEKIPAVTKTVTSKIPQFNRHVPKNQRPKDKKRKGGSYSQVSNARVKRVSVTGEKPKKK